jgi:hypothetical protein
MATALLIDKNGNPSTSTGTQAALAAIIAAAFAAGTVLRLQYSN